MPAPIAPPTTLPIRAPNKFFMAHSSLVEKCRRTHRCRDSILTRRTIRLGEGPEYQMRRGMQVGCAGRCEERVEACGRDVREADRRLRVGSPRVALARDE